MTLLKNKILLRNAIFVALAFVVLPAYGGPPLVEVFGCEDFQLTYTGGYPAAGCFGFGGCTRTGSGDLFVDILLYSNMDCPNQAVFNETTVSGTVGGYCLLGVVQGFCADAGRVGFVETGYCKVAAMGLVSTAGPLFNPTIAFWDPYSQIRRGGGGGGGVIICDAAFAVCDPPQTWSFDSCECIQGPSPVLIDTSGDGFALTDAAHGVNFDLNNDGVAEPSSWTTPDSDAAFLVLDRNGNGKIDNGRELFGNYTPQSPSGDANGFLALAEFDKPVMGGNRDGVIDSQDSIFSQLRLWHDRNHNGISESNELETLAHFGITKIELQYWLSNRRDEYGNHFRYRAKVYGSHGSQVTRWAWDIFFVNR